MDNSILEKQYVEALNKACDALLLAAVAIGSQAGSLTLKNSPQQENTPPLTYKYESRRLLENGNEEITLTTYKLNPQTGMLEVVKVDVKEQPAA